jgi:hypothetical protein
MGRIAAGLLAGVALALPAAASAANCPSGALPGSQPEARASGQPIEFGIFPGSQAGAVAGPQQQAKPDDAARTGDALAGLRGGRPFAVHLYLEFTNGPDMPDRIAAAEELTDRYRAQGLDVEYVLAYRPRTRAGASDVAAFVTFTRAMVARLGPRLHALQVTNEVNNSLSPDASDGAYPGASDALVQGVIAAKEEARARGLRELEIGFNWMYRQSPQTDQQFWEYLRDHGGARFVRALDWVGADVYPGTFFPPAVTSYRDAVVNALDVLRTCYMTIPDIPKTVPIHITESGYPTGPGRSYDEQSSALSEMVRAYRDFSGNYNVSDYRWFLLRDADSDSDDFQQQYGLLRDDYSPKPAFAAYRELIARLGGPPLSEPKRGGGRIRLTARPRRVRAGRRTRFRFTSSVPGASIHFAHRRTHAGDDGKATLTVRLRAPGRRRARASLPGYAKAVTVIRVLRPRAPAAPAARR